MESKKKLISLMVLSLIVGVVGGFSFGKSGGSKAIEIKNANAPTVTNVDTRKTELALQKIDLLKYYTNFVLLPKEKFADPKKYGEDMSTVVAEINDNEITSRYNATAEVTSDEQRINNIRNLLNYLSDSIKTDLK